MLPDVVASSVLLNDFQRQWTEIGSDVHAAVELVGTSGWYILGQEVRDFEAAFASFWPAAHVVGVGSGLDAIEIALRVAGLRLGDRVLTTPLSAFATTLAIVRAGGIPVFCDTDAGGLMDLDEADAVLEAEPAIRFLIPVHLYGYSLDLDRLAALRDRHELTLIEDCAQSVGATWNGRRTGTVGQVAATSFYPTKNAGAMGDGGAVITSDLKFAERARQLRDYGQSAKYRHDELGWNSRLDELHAAILRRAILPRLGTWTEHRRQIASRYLSGIKHPEVRLLTPPAASQPCGHLFPVFVEHAQRESLQSWLKQHGVQSGQHYPLLITQQLALGTVPWVAWGDLPNAAAVAAGEISLPIHPHLRDSEAEQVITAVNSWPSK